MKFRNKIVMSWILIAVLAFSLVPTTFAKSFPAQVTENLTKSWKIKFNQPVDKQSLDSDTIYILDGTKKINTKIDVLDGGYTVEITPSASYEPGKTYRLEVSQSIKSTNGKFLNSKTTMPFSVINSSASIQSIQQVSAEGLIHFKVRTNEDVYSVKINGVDLHLTGWNEFSHTFLNLKVGSTVTIRTYSSTNKVLETKKYKIEE